MAPQWRPSSKFFCCVFSAAALVSFNGEAAAQSACWTSTGPAGTVDESGLDTVELGGDTAAIRSAVSSGSVTIYYNVTALPGVMGGECTKLSARLADTGDASQVIVRLRELNLENGQTADILQIDSNEFPSSGVAQHRSASTGRHPFDFERNVYGVSVELKKTGRDGNPLVRGLQVCGVPIC